MKTILILGGYGNFGKRIVEDLSYLPGITIYIAGRHIEKADRLVQQLSGKSVARLQAIELDIYKIDFELKLQEISPDIVIHTSGPFQGQSHQVPIACINAGAHYIDLADDRKFVCDITTLDQLARDRNVLAVSGASSVPGLSSTVVDYYQSQFSAINSIDIAIAPGNKAERGEATVRGILSYTGHPFAVFNNATWTTAYGWMEPRVKDFGDIIGKRWLANVDVPDLAIFPARYSVQHTVKFQAGLELSVLHLMMVAMGYVAKIGLVKNWAPLTKLIVKTSDLFKPFGSDIGGMQVTIKGLNHHNEEKRVNWQLYAPAGVGPYIPTLSAVILAKKLIQGELTDIGATPCLGLYGLDEFKQVAETLNIFFKEQVIG